MAFGDLDFTLRGRRGTHGVGLALLARLGPVWRHCRPGCLRGRRGAWRHLASEAFGNIDGRFLCQAWTWRRRPSPCGAGVAFGDIDRHFGVFCVTGVVFWVLGWLLWPLLQLFYK